MTLLLSKFHYYKVIIRLLQVLIELIEVNHCQAVLKRSRFKRDGQSVNKASLSCQMAPREALDNPF